MVSDRLDCVIIGYNDLGFDEMLAGAEATTKHSPMHDELRRSSVRFEGKRRPYMELFNRSLELGRGENPDLHVCELPALGVAYLSSFLRKRSFDVEHVNFFSRERDKLRDLLATNPRSVAITTTFYVANDPIADICRFVRAHCPTTKIIVGGPHIYNICESVDSSTADYIFDSVGADIFVHDSQGEATLARVLAALRTGDNPDLSDIPNLFYSEEGGSFRHTERVLEDNDMDENVVDWSHFDRDFYRPTAQIRTARSCAFKCAFCRYPAVAGPLNLNSVEVVERSLRELADAGVEHLVFIDDTFNVPLPRFKDLCRMMIRNDFGLKWYSYFRCSASDDETYDLMAESGCKGAFMGVESGDQDVLNYMDKSSKTSKYKYGIGKLKERGIATYASFVVGFPGETEQSIQNTIAFLEEAAPMFYSAGVWYYDDKTPIARRAEEFDLKGGGFNWRHRTMDWKKANEQATVLYRSVKNSTILPTFMFDFWSLPYLAGKGLSVEQIEGFARIAHQGLLRGLDDDAACDPETDRALAEFFRNGHGSGSGVGPDGIDVAADRAPR